jgi:hypothetical protein
LSSSQHKETSLLLNELKEQIPKNFNQTKGQYKKKNAEKHSFFSKLNNDW